MRVEAGPQQGQFAVRRLTATELAGTQDPSTTSIRMNALKIAVPASELRSSLSHWINSPLTAAWLLAIAVVTLFAIVMLTPRFRLAAPRPSVSPVTQPQATEYTSVAEMLNRDAASGPPEQTANPSPVAPAPITIDVTPPISALQPANVDDVLPWPPPVVIAAEMPVPVVPAVKKIDLESKMAQRFPLYKQATPVSRRILIEVLEEQLGAPIRYDGDELGTGNLDKTVTFELENTTIGDVIRAVADMAGWQIVAEPTGLRLKRKE